MYENKVHTVAGDDGKPTDARPTVDLSPAAAMPLTGDSDQANIQALRQCWIRRGALGGLLLGMVAGIVVVFGVMSPQDRREVGPVIAMPFVYGLYGFTLGGLAAKILADLVYRKKSAARKDGRSWTRRGGIGGLVVGGIVGIVLVSSHSGQSVAASVLIPLVFGCLIALLAMITAAILETLTNWFCGRKPERQPASPFSRGARRGGAVGLVFALMISGCLTSIELQHSPYHPTPQGSFLGHLIFNFIVFGLVCFPFFAAVGGVLASVLHRE